MSEPIRHNESLSSAALDGARIAALLALELVANDPDIPRERLVTIVYRIQNALDYLHAAREAFPVLTTSVHIIEAGG